MIKESHAKVIEDCFTLIPKQENIAVKPKIKLKQRQQQKQDSHFWGQAGKVNIARWSAKVNAVDRTDMTASTITSKFDWPYFYCFD